MKDLPPGANDLVRKIYLKVDLFAATQKENAVHKNATWLHNDPVSAGEFRNPEALHLGQREGEVVVLGPADNVAAVDLALLPGLERVPRDRAIRVEEEAPLARQPDSAAAASGAAARAPEALARELDRVVRGEEGARLEDEVALAGEAVVDDVARELRE